MGTRFSAPVQTGRGAHPASCTMVTKSFPGVESGRDETLTPHALLVPWSRKCRAIPLLPLWAVRPVQSLSDCTRVHFTLYPLPFTIELFTTQWLLCVPTGSKFKKITFCLYVLNGSENKQRLFPYKALRT